MRSPAPQTIHEAMTLPAFSIEALRPLTRIDNRRGVLYFFWGIAGALFPALLFATVPTPFGLLLALGFSLRHFSFLAQIVHLSDHLTLHRSPRLNRLFGDSCAWILGYSRNGHREVHLDHHLYLNSEKDPDAEIFGAANQSKQDLVRGALRDLGFVTAYRRLFQYRASQTKTPLGSLPICLVQLGLFLFYARTTGALAYFIFHLGPLTTLYPLLIRIRSAAEHGADDEINSHSHTFTLSWPERFLLGALGQQYHYEHHLFPKVPGYRLSEIRRRLVESEIELPLRRGYLRTVLSR
jgi:fatty acid desaturase